MAASVHAARRPVNADLAHERSTLCYFTQAPHVAWDRLAEITGQFLSKGQLVDVEGRLQTRQWDDDAGTRHWKTEVVVASLEMLSGRSKKEYARESQALVDDPDGAPAANGAAAN